VEIEEYDRGNKAPIDVSHYIHESEKVEKQLPQKEISTEIQDIADKVKRSVEEQLKMKFEKFRVIDFESFPADVHHTSFFIKVATDNNGYVRFRVTETENMEDWIGEIEEYDKGNVPIDVSHYLRGNEKPQGNEKPKTNEPSSQLSQGIWMTSNP